MSGFGSGKASGHGRRYHVECASVNRKGLDIVVTLPRGLNALEPQVREEVQKLVKRGRIHIAITEELLTKQTSKNHFINQTAAAAAWKELLDLQRTLKLSTAPSLETLLHLPGIIKEESSHQIDLSDTWKLVQQALSIALKTFLQMRLKEGRHHATDLKKRVRLLEQMVKKMVERAPIIFQHRRTQLGKRLADLGVPIPADSPSLLRELALFAERSDIHEELVRLQSHFIQCQELLSSAGEARTFDYLAQEMFREFNTLGNKANDATISHWVVQAKSELDKIREQLANLE
ncbi:MAG: YicC family protein [Chthoniobacterales bacterium]|nr:YicC family protein [Chthoniobacterales bacterium]